MTVAVPVAEVATGGTSVAPFIGAMNVRCATGRPALSKALPLSLVFLAVVGMGGVLTMASSNTLVQTFAEEESRGLRLQPCQK